MLCDVPGPGDAVGGLSPAGPAVPGLVPGDSRIGPAWPGPDLLTAVPVRDPRQGVDAACESTPVARPAAAMSGLAASGSSRYGLPEGLRQPHSAWGPRSRTRFPGTPRPVRAARPPPAQAAARPPPAAPRLAVRRQVTPGRLRSKAARVRRGAITTTGSRRQPALQPPPLRPLRQRRRS
jgi:hypothetical protein